MNNIQKALERIDVTNYDNCSYNDWIELLYTCKAAGVSFSDFDGWAQGGSKYDAESIKASWYSASPTESEETARKRLFYKAKMFLPQISEGKTIDSIPAYEKDLALDNAKKFLNYIDNGKNWVLAPEFLDENGKKTFVDDANCLNSAKEFSDNLDKLEFDFFSKAVGFCFTSNSCDKSWKKGSATDFRYCFIESDEMRLTEQFRLALSKKLPVFAGIFSGGKSIHLWCRVDAKDRMEWEERVDFIKDFLRKNNINFDESVLNNPEHLTRFPLGKRVVFDKTTGARTESNQYIVYFDDNCKSFKEWKKELDAKAPLPCPFVFNQQKNKAEFYPDRLLELENRLGFFSYIEDNKVFLCKREDYKLEEISADLIEKELGETFKRNFKNFYNDFLKSLRSRNTSFHQQLKTISTSVHEDTKDTVFLYFKNGILEIKGDSKKLIPYDEMPENFLIWKDEIIDRSYKEDESDGDWSKFVELITSDMSEDESGDKAVVNEKRLKAVKSALGYLVSRYKDPSRAKAVCFVDGCEQPGANGGSGKSLLVKSLDYVRKTGNLDGKRLNENTFRFAFSDLRKDQAVFHIEDIKKDFKFDLFYNMVTSGVSVEKKGVNTRVIPFKDAPKFALTANYLIRGATDESTERRLEIYEISKFFNINNTPEGFFKRRFFEDWKEEEWNKFYAFIVECVQIFLKEGLISYTDDKIERRKIASSVGSELEYFIHNWMKEKKLDGTEKFKIIDIFQRYKEFYGLKARYGSSTSFSPVFKKYFEGGIENRRNDRGKFFTIDFEKCKVFEGKDREEFGLSARGDTDEKGVDVSRLYISNNHISLKKAIDNN